MATAANTVAYYLGFKNEVKGTGVFSNFELKRGGATAEASAAGDAVSTVIFVVGAAAAFSAVNTLDMASKGL